MGFGQAPVKIFAATPHGKRYDFGNRSRLIRLNCAGVSCEIYGTDEDINLLCYCPVCGCELYNHYRRETSNE